MNFRFRADSDEQRNLPSSSDHPLRDDFPNAGMMRDPSSSSEHPRDDSTNIIRNWNYQFEIEKQRILEEILIKEMATRRIIHAEIRNRSGLMIDQYSSIMPSLNQYSREPLALSNSPPVFQSPEPREDETKRTDNEEKIMFLPKPEPKGCEGKRKAEALHEKAETEPPPVRQKQANDKWICTMCNITAVSEIVFNSHLQGKKHRAKERTRLQAGETEKIVKSLETEKEPNGKIQQEMVQKNNAPEDPKKAAEALKKRGFKCWCEVCQIGTQSEAVMETHKKGKKHLARLQRRGEDDAATSSAALVEANEAATRGTETRKKDEKIDEMGVPPAGREKYLNLTK